MLETPTSIDNIHVILDVVNVNVPPLTGLNVVDGHKRMIHNFNNKLEPRTQLMLKNEICYIEEWHVPIFKSPFFHLHTRKEPIDTVTTNFTVSELKRLNRSFFYPSPTKRFNLLKRTNPSEADPPTQNILNDITKICDSCQRIGSAPLRVRVSFGSDSEWFN